MLLTNQNIGVKISIYYTGKIGPVTVYVETQTPTTNENGLVSIEIGTGKVVTGVFADINWAARTHYLKTEIDPGGRTTSYSISSDTQILSVPYALHAKTATTSQKAESISISGAAYIPEYVVDIDGNAYKTIKIGNQVWMAENLKTTRYRNGEAIPNVKNGTQWAALTTGAWCDYNNFAVNGNKFGHLYNWYAVSDPRNLAPEGWHVPTNAEWTELENYLIANGGNWDGTLSGNKIAKSMAATTDWNISTALGAIGNDLTINNRSGFSALPGGYYGDDGVFYQFGNCCHFWSSSTVTTCHRLYYFKNDLIIGSSLKAAGYSVRCVKD